MPRLDLLFFKKTETKRNGNFVRAESIERMIITTELHNENKTTPRLQSDIVIKMPKELVFVLFQHLDDTAATCLGLTCRSLYNIYKSTVTDLVPLNSFTIDPTTAKEVYLHDLLIKWMGPKYRWPIWKDLWVVPIPEYSRFLSKKVYGEELGRKERLLASRWHDYHHSLLCETHYSNPFAQQAAAFPCGKRLPNPYGMGEAWDEEAKKVIMADARWRYNLGDFFGCWGSAVVFWSESCFGDVVVYYIRKGISKVRLEAERSRLHWLGFTLARLLVQVAIWDFQALISMFALAMLPLAVTVILYKIIISGKDWNEVLDDWGKERTFKRKEKVFQKVLEVERQRS